MIMAGGAVAAACDELADARARASAPGCCRPGARTCASRAARWWARRGASRVAEVARTWYRRPQDLPADVDPGGLEVTAGYKAKRDTGTFSYAAHAAVVAVDPETGEVEILDYVVVEDGGVLVNPMIVDGQIYGGAAQGIGTALYEEMRFDAQGQPLASTLSDYLLPGPTEVPDIRILHMETPSPYTRFGQKGLGEGGAIAPPAAITNAVNDALKGLGAELLVSPITPRRIVEAIERARAEGGSAHEAGRLRLRAAGDPWRGGAAARRRRPDAKVLAGGQTLGPMLNLRLAQPALLVDITRIPELAAVREDADARHHRRHRHARGHRGWPRRRSDRRLSAPGSRAASPTAPCARAAPSAAASPMPIPAADWLSCLTALGAEVRDRGSAAARAACALADFVRGAMETDAGATDELLVGSPHPEVLAARRASASTRSAARPASSPTPSASPCTIPSAAADAARGQHARRRADRHRCARTCDREREAAADAARPASSACVAAGFAGDAYELQARMPSPLQRAIARRCAP